MLMTDNIMKIYDINDNSSIKLSKLINTKPIESKIYVGSQAKRSRLFRHTIVKIMAAATAINEYSKTKAFNSNIIFHSRSLYFNAFSRSSKCICLMIVFVFSILLILLIEGSCKRKILLFGRVLFLIFCFYSIFFKLNPQFCRSFFA